MTANTIDEILDAMRAASTQCAGFADQIAALSQQPAAVDGAIDKARFERAPCYLCGYNGPGYYQPDTHPCAAKYHAAQQPAEQRAEIERLRKDAARYRWLRTRWGRIADEYDGDSDQLVAIREADSHFEGWDVDPASLDRAIDAAMKEEGHG